MGCACEVLIVNVSAMVMGNYGCTAFGDRDTGMDDLPDMCIPGLRVRGRYIRWAMSAHVTTTM